MDAGLIAAVALAIVFAVRNGVHDASNAIATLVATRAACPGATWSAESGAMSSPPDAGLAEMAGLLRDAVGHISEAVPSWVGGGGAPDSGRGGDPRGAPARARLLPGMAVLLELDVRNERISSRELYRRCARIGAEVVDVAERIIYAVVKESCPGRSVRA